MSDGLQVENGNFTRIVNPLIDRLLLIPFKGCELAVALFIIRKTYGYHKTQDEISLQQICKGINKSKPTVLVALKNLQLVKLALLVKQGNTKGDCNIWKINKYHDTWELVKLAYLVTRKRGAGKASVTESGNAGVTYKRKKKYNTKERERRKTPHKVSFENTSQEIPEIIKLFEVINPSVSKFYGNKSQRAAVERLLEKHGREKLESIINFLPKSNMITWFKITTPCQLEDRMGELIATMQQKKLQAQETKSKSAANVAFN